MTFSFPAGLTGAAFLVIRIQAAMIGYQFALQAGGPQTWPGKLVLALSALLLIGLLTRLSALLLAVFLAAPLAFGRGDFPAAAHAGALVALAMIGAGAYSADAWLFGRRVIRISS